MSKVSTKLRRVALNVCDACIEGVGQECHTPGCILYLHCVDLPITRELMEFFQDGETLHGLREELTAARAVIDIMPEWGGAFGYPGAVQKKLDAYLARYRKPVESEGSKG